MEMFPDGMKFTRIYLFRAGAVARTGNFREFRVFVSPSVLDAALSMQTNFSSMAWFLTALLLRVAKKDGKRWSSLSGLPGSVKIESTSAKEGCCKSKK
jgi:hypothetical protein